MCFQRVSMGAYVVFLVFVLGCSLAEGRIVSKCEMMEVFHNLPGVMKQKGLTGNLVAKIVCHVEEASGFNTSAVTLLTPGTDEEVWTLYGLFQLSTHLVCSSGTTPSPNICQIDCNDLIDDDIDNDISCLWDIFNYLLKNGFWSTHSKELIKMMRLIFQEECRFKTAFEYFAECA